MNPSGSALERASHCPASCALPKASHTGEAAIKGTDNHDKIEVALVVGGDLSNQPEAVRKAMVGATAVDVEVAYAINVETEMVRIIGRRIGRNYGKLEPGEIPLTVDAVITYGIGTTVYDWKSRARVTPAKHNLQIRAGCVAAMKTLGLASVGGAIAYLDDGYHDAITVDVFDMAAFFADMRKMLADIEEARERVALGGPPDVHAGPWCTYCPSMAYCPAHTQLARHMLGEIETIQKEIAFFSVEQVSKAWDLKKRLETMLEGVDESLRLRIQQSVIPRAGGKRLALVEVPGRTSFSKDKALARIRELGGATDDLTMQGKPFLQVQEVNMNGADK